MPSLLLLAKIEQIPTVTEEEQKDSHIDSGEDELITNQVANVCIIYYK